jgi:polyferredoxin
LKLRQRAALDLLTLPGLGSLLRWRHARTLFQSVLLGLAVLILLDGWFGPSLAPRNLAGVLPWVHWRGFVVLGLLVAGNLFCMACPFMLPRRLAKRWFPAHRTWPAVLQSKGVAVALLVAFFWSYEAFSLWESPWLTAWVVLAYFALAFAVDAFFQGASFCRWVCPIGQFQFVNAMASPLEVRVRDAAVCGSCETKDCIRGRYERAAPAPSEDPAWVGRPIRPVGTASSGRALGLVGLAQGGCEMALYLPGKVGNLDCTLCMECIHACPHDNIGILVRSPLSDLTTDPVRAGVGRLSARTDLAVLASVLIFGAWVNAFGMVEPIARLEGWVAGQMGLGSRPWFLIAFYLFSLGLVPGVLLTGVGRLGQELARRRGPLGFEIRRHIWGLVPVGLAMWTAHYLFHLLIGGMAAIPLLQTYLNDLGIPAGPPLQQMGPVVPEGWILPLQIVILQGGLLLSLVALLRISRDLSKKDRAGAQRGFVPWALLAAVLATLGVWLLAQPMQMRGTLFAMLAP